MPASLNCSIGHASGKGTLPAISLVAKQGSAEDNLELMGFVVSDLSSDKRYRDLPEDHPVVVEQDKFYAQLCRLQFSLIRRRTIEEALNFASYPTWLR